MRSIVLLLPLLFLVACGGSSAPEAFLETPPPAPGGGGGETPAPTPVPPSAWTADAHTYDRIAFFGSFPSALARHGDTLFATDADQIEAAGARILAMDVSGGAPVASSTYAATTITAPALVDSNGAVASLTSPIGFGFFVNEILIVSDELGFALVNAGGSDSLPTLSNLIVFDPLNGGIKQVVNLANPYAPGTPLLDSNGGPVPGGMFTQSGAEGLEYVTTAQGVGRVYVAMSNLVFGAPSYGAVKYPGTVQVYRVDTGAQRPITATADAIHATRTIGTQGYNPVSIQSLAGLLGPLAPDRVLVTCAGTTAFDVNWNLAPVTNSTVESYTAETLAFEGQFVLGLAGLSGIRPSIGRDAAGHLVGFFPSSVTGEVYLLLLDGLSTFLIDPSRLDVLRGPENGIEITAAQAGAPGGNITGTALSPDGRTLAVSGFGDIFAGLPGRLFLLTLPADVVTGAGFGTDFTPGSTEFASAVGRTLGEIVLIPSTGGGPDVYVNVSGAVDATTGVGRSAASLGTLDTGGLIR